MKISNWKVCIGLLGLPIGVSLLIWLLIVCFTGMIGFYENYGIFWGSVFSIAGIILAIPFIGIICLFLFFLKPYTKMLNLSISMDNDGGLVITNPSSEFKIHKPSIKYILNGSLATTIVWSPDDSQNSIKTFRVRKQYFSSKEYKKFISELSASECFSDDVKQNKKISVENGLDHIFRKNKLEFEL